MGKWRALTWILADGVMVKPERLGNAGAMWFALYFWRSLAVVSWRRWRRGPLLATWSWLFEVITVTQKAFHERVARLTPQAERRAWAGLRGKAPHRARAQRRELRFGGVPVVSYEFAGASKTTLLYLHGGSFLYGAEGSHGELCASLAEAGAARALFVSYRLAPEHPCPAALSDTLACYRALVASGVRASDVVVAGDSAGGNLALGLLLALRDAGEAQPRAAVLISPWLDLSAHGGSLEENEPFDWASPWMFERWTRLYAGERVPSDPLLSPALAELSGLSPLYVTVGTAELLLDQVRRFVHKASAAGVEVTYHEVEGMTHLWLSLAPMIPSFRADLRQIGRFIQRTGQ